MSELANELSTQMLLDELKCLWLNFWMKTHTALYPIAINLPALPASHQRPPQGHLWLCSASLTLPVPPNSCLLSQDANQVPPAPGEGRLLHDHMRPCTARLTSCRHVTQLPLSWALSSLQEDSIWSLGFCSPCLRQHSVQEQTQIFVRHRLNSFAQSINSCRQPFKIMSFSVCCLQLSRVLTAVIQIIMTGSTSKQTLFIYK